MLREQKSQGRTGGKQTNKLLAILGVGDFDDNMEDIKRADESVKGTSLEVKTNEQDKIKE